MEETIMVTGVFLLNTFLLGWVNIMGLQRRKYMVHKHGKEAVKDVLH